MMLYGSIKGYLQSYRRKRVIKSIRESMEWFGCSVSTFTDEEIEEGMVELGKVFASFGVTMEEAQNAFSSSNG